MHKNNNSNGYRCELRQKILDTAMPLFKQKGIKSVKMDEIASILSISKRTLYEIYDNKEQLLFEGIKRDDETATAYIIEYARNASNEMEIIMEYVKMKMRELSSVNPIYFNDLHKYDMIIEYLHEQHEKQHRKSLTFIKNGVEHGYFMPNLNYQIVVNISDAVVNHVMKTRMYEKYPLSEIFRNIVSILLRGYCTEKGIRMLDSVL